MRILISGLLVVAATSLLQGCFPLVATGVGAGVMAAEDRRTVGTLTDDQSIEFKASNRISERFKDGTHVNVTSYNRVVLLTGEVPNEQVKREVERIVRSVENVRAVTNELTIGPVTALSARAGDSFITSKVKARFVDASRFNPVHVKVVTENKVAYLLGMVKRQEAKDAIEITRTTEGVQKVVVVFEYLD
jgi:osmotically-inducible protein OsmY